MAHKLELVTSDLVKENDLLRLVLGVCPALSMTTVAFDSLVVGGMVTGILVLSQIILSFLLKKLPETLGVPLFVSLVAGFVTMLDMLTQAYYPEIYDSLGENIPLFVVNCLILGKITDSPSLALANGFKMGLGFTGFLGIIGICREILGMGTCFAVYVLPENVKPFTAISDAPGGFLFFGLILAFISFFHHGEALEECAAEEAEKTSQPMG